MLDIRPVTKQERNLTGFDYVVLWGGVGISLAEIWAGGFLAGMGLWLGLLVILLGHLIGNTLMALGGVIGSEYGLMSMVSVRPAFGIRGSNLASVLNIIQLIGWPSIMLIIGGRAGAMLGQGAGGLLADDRFWIVVIGMGTLFWALMTGKKIWKILQWMAVAGLLIIMALMTWISATGLTAETTLPAPVAPLSFMKGLDLVIAMPISWLPLVSDYSRFAYDTRRSFWGTWGGYFVVSSWMYILGLLASTLTGTEDPGVLILEVMGRVGLAVPALVMVVFSTVTSDFPDIYSATCSMMNITGRIGPKLFMWITGIVSILVAMIFPAQWYEGFLLMIGGMFIPLFGIVLVDYFLIRKGRLNLEAIYTPGGEYWYTNGVNIVAVIAWGVGFALFELIAVMDWSVGSSIPSMLAAGSLYYLTADRSADISDIPDNTKENTDNPDDTN